MKQIIVALLFPIYVLINLFKKIIEIAFEIGIPIVDGILILQEIMYNYWKDIFKWKE